MLVFLTLIISKTILRLLRLTGRGGGSALPGLVAERIDPKLATKLSRNLPKGVIVVTGTNGKTTTTKMLAEILRASGERVMTNRSGSNLTRGVVSSLVEKASLRGRLPGTIGLFEVDEASMPEACRLLQPKIIVVLNLLRDQLDRYGELDKTASMIRAGIAATAAEVWLNADDPLVASLGRESSNAHYFGVENTTVSRLAHDRAADSDHCPICGRALVYSQNFFGHIGHYRCAQGHFERPKPEVEATEVRSSQSGVRFRIGSQEAEIKLPGLYNAYNALAAVAAATSLSISVKEALKAVEQVSAAFGRVEQVELAGRKVFLLLIKNPTGFNQVIQTFFSEFAVPGPKPEARSSESAGISSENMRTSNFELRTPILIAINDNFADGRDVSWLWDVAIEEITPRSSQKSKVKSQKSEIIVSGVRAYDMAIRLKYAEITSEVEPDLGEAVKKLVQATPKGETAYILPTYTAMLAIRKLITKEAGLEGFWK